MTISRYKQQLLALLHLPLLTRPQLRRLIARAIATNPRPAARRWYVSLCWTYLEAIFLVACGMALGVALVVILHYTGIEAWVESMHNLQN
ncbi:MAG: hypothetical protein WBM09_11685 [Gallionella sp.]